MTVTPTAGDLEAYMREAAALSHETISLPPFVIYLNPEDPFRFHNYAKLERSDVGEVAGQLEELRALFRARNRLPRFEYLEDYAPGFAAVLEKAGFEHEGRYLLMVCTPDTLRRPDAPEGLEIQPVTGASSYQQVFDFVQTQKAGFAELDNRPVTEQEITSTRARLGRNGTFLGRLDGQPAGVAVFTTPLDGFTELVGIATAPEYRGRGIAAALTAHAAGNAFDRGVRVAFLTAADERAGRVYERAGFSALGWALVYADPDLQL